MGDRNGFCEGGGDDVTVTNPTTTSSSTITATSSTTITASSSEAERVVVESVGDGKPVSAGASSKKNLFKKIFMPWKWKAKRKTEKLKQRCTILERKISVI